MKLRLTHCLLALALSTNLIRVEAFAHEVQQKTVERREVYIPISDFILVDQNSREFRFSKLTGRVVVVAFAYTTCPDIYPLITAALRQVQSGLTPDERTKAFTCLPSQPIRKSTHQRCSQVMANAMAQIFYQLVVYSGDQAALQKVWKKFGVGVKRKARGLVDHTPLTAVVDHQGRSAVVYLWPSAGCEGGAVKKISS